MSLRFFHALCLLLGIGLTACGGGGGSSESPTPTPPDTGTNIAGVPAAPTADPADWWNRAVFYEVFVRSFADAAQGPKAGDGIGDFSGLLERLDYLNDGNPNTTDDLGVTALWLMPMFDSPSYHGYDVRDYYATEPDYGSLPAFRALVQEAHARGMKVILDLVLNHASSSHPRFTASKNAASPYRDWFVWRSANPGAVVGPWGQTVWHRDGSDWYYGVFWSGMPDWNLTNDAVTTYLHDVARYWLQDVGVDGFRLDAVRYLVEDGTVLSDSLPTHDWLGEFYAHTKAVAPDAMTVGEVWASSDIVAAYKNEMDLSFQFDLADAILEAARNGTGSRLEAELNRAWNQFDPSRFAVFLTNHDQDRVLSQLGGDVGKARLAATILLTIPGVPFLYYGEEIGMQGVKPDELIRRPLQWTSAAGAGFTTGTPWQAPNADYRTVNIAFQNADAGSLLQHYRRLIHLRRENPALAYGAYHPVTTSSNNILAFVRRATNQSVLVLLNVGAGNVTNFSVHLDAAYDQAAELLHGVPVSKGAAVRVNGVDGYQPLAELEGRTGYIIRLP